jgi:hypothetical protein
MRNILDVILLQCSGSPVVEIGELKKLLIPASAKVPERFLQGTDGD